MMIGVDLSGTRLSMPLSRLPRAMWRAPGMAPCSCSSGSRTSSSERARPARAARRPRRCRPRGSRPWWPRAGHGSWAWVLLSGFSGREILPRRSTIRPGRVFHNLVSVGGVPAGTPVRQVAGGQGWPCQAFYRCVPVPWRPRPCCRLVTFVVVASGPGFGARPFTTASPTWSRHLTIRDGQHGVRDLAESLMRSTDGGSSWSRDRSRHHRRGRRPRWRSRRPIPGRVLGHAGRGRLPVS